MQVYDTPSSKPIISNVDQTSSFMIKATAKSFATLSSGLYSNKIKAIVQELGANAKDSHVQAGKPDVPFEVHLPTVFEPYFSVKDFGVGLSQEEVYSIYTTYFASTKTTSNDYIGALGLGSKTPFSYTNNFTVIATKNNKTGIYTAYINDNGIPSIALMTEFDSDSSQGVEVKFAVVNSQDMKHFQEEANNVYKWFDVIPNIIGNEITINPVSYKEQNLITKCNVLQPSGYSHQQTSYALMGGIAYPIDKSVFPNHERLLDCGLVLKFDIGMLDVQANREGLSYDAQTKSTINQVLDDVAKEVIENIKLQYDSCKNIWEQITLYKKCKSSLVENYATSLYLKNTIHYGIISQGYLLIYTSDIKEQYNIQAQMFNKTNYSKNYYLSESLSLNNDSIVIINDLKRGGVQLAKEYGKNNSHQKILLLKATEPEEITNIQKLISDYLHDFPNVVKTSEIKLDIPKKSEKISYDVSIISIERVKYESKVVIKPQHFFEENSSETYYYLLLNNKTIDYQKCRKDVDTQRFIEMITPLNKSTIYGIKRSSLKFIKDKPNWINLEDLIVDKLKEITREEIISMYIKQQNHISDFMTAGIIKDVMGISTPLPINISYSTYRILVVSFFDIKTPIIDELDEFMKKLYIKYPLLEIAENQHFRNSYKDAFIKYTQQIDQLNSQEVTNNE